MQNIINSYVAILRQEAKMNTDDSMALALALLSWARLHQLRPDQFTTSPLDFKEKPRQVADEMERLDANSPGLPLGLARAASTWDDIGKRVQEQLLEQLKEDVSRDRLSELVPLDVVLRGAPDLQPALADLMVALGDADLHKGTVYLPWANTAQIAGRVLQRGGSIDVETPEQVFPPLGLVAALLGAENKVHLKANDLDDQPAYQDMGQLNQYNLVISTLPSVPRIRHVLTKTSGRAIILVHNTVLFGSTEQRNLRNDLLNSGDLEAVISLPPGQIDGMQGSASLLILNRRDKQEVVRMVSLETAGEYVVSEGGNSLRLTHISAIAALVLGNQESPVARSVTYRELYENDISLLPSRYVISDEWAKVEGLLRPYQVRSLDEIADIIRTTTQTRASAMVDALEVGAAEMTDSGYMIAPTKQVQTQYISEKDTAHFLRPLDVVVVFKGSIGKVGICPATAPSPGPGGWVAGQSVLIVRCKPGAISPKVLVMLLRSPVGKALIARITEGAAQPFLKVSTLRKLNIPVPQSSEVIEIEAVFDEQASIQEKIQSLEVKLAKTIYPQWNI